MSDQVCTVRVSRLLLALIFGVGALFLCFGLELLVLHQVFAPEDLKGSPALRWGGGLAMAALGGLIAGQTLLNLLMPPVMLRVDRENLTYGTGFRYNPTSMPMSALRSVEVFKRRTEVNGQTREVVGGVRFSFDPESGVPQWAATSAGISYQNHTLELSRAYMDCAPEEVVSQVERLRGR